MEKKKRSNRLNRAVVGIKQLIDALKNGRRDAVRDSFAVFNLERFAFEKIVVDLEELVGQRILECNVDRRFFVGGENGERERRVKNGKINTRRLNDRQIMMAAELGHALVNRMLRVGRQSGETVELSGEASDGRLVDSLQSSGDCVESFEANELRDDFVRFFNASGENLQRGGTEFEVFVPENNLVSI